MKDPTTIGGIEIGHDVDHTPYNIELIGDSFSTERSSHDEPIYHFNA